MSLENLDNVIDFIIDNGLIAKGDRVGIGVSGGVDSMSLLHFLHSISQQAGFSVIAVNVNHNIRPGSRKDSAFVSKFCKENGIEHVNYNVDVPSFAKQQKMGIEQAARIKRYEAFETAIKKKKLDKIALAHHAGDQAETILLNIFRGSGLTGASGMQAKRGPFIRPFLETKKEDLVAYCYRMQVPHVEDESNNDDRFSRNFIRNQVMPLLQSEWRGVQKNIIDFGKNCRMDDEYLNSIVETSWMMGEENLIRIPLNLFLYPAAIVNRIVIAGFEKIGRRENIEKKHVELVVTLALTGENGSRSDLPGGMFAVREYEHIAIVKKQSAASTRVYSFKIGKTVFAEYGSISVIKTISYKEALNRGLMVMDVDKVPKNAKWRTRKDGDVFTKFGGGTKALAAYMIDKKIPARLRDRIPVLAVGNEILAVAGVEISDKAKVDDQTIEAYVLEFLPE